ncbi:hypothetical protein B0H13DRAFT_1936493 [Mycena leptocephala]|nr:hypothetical protein B0H13DRAFT_1936493 [Mycena leptocephala]
MSSHVHSTTPFHRSAAPNHVPTGWNEYIVSPTLYFTETDIFSTFSRPTKPLTMLRAPDANANLRNLLTPPATPRAHHNDERRVLRELRSNTERSPRRRRVPNAVGRPSGNSDVTDENTPPSARPAPNAAKVAAQKRRRERERRERGKITQHSAVPPERVASKQEDESSAEMRRINRQWT